MQVGGGTKGYPTADVSGIIIVPAGALKIALRWTDPDDTVLDNVVLAAWESTVVVRKDGAVPENIKDGVVVVESTVRNQYQTEQYIDESGLEDMHTYYYRLFTKSTTGVIGDGSPTVKMTAKLIDPILANNTWEQIAEVAESGGASEVWDIGDEITVSISSEYFSKITLQIADFNHYDKADGTGKAGIVFVTKDLLTYPGGSSDPRRLGVSFNTQSGGRGKGYLSSNIGQCVNGLFNSIDSNVTKYAKTVVLSCDDGDNYTEVKGHIKCFTPSVKELGGGYGIDSSTQLPIFSDNASRKKKALTTSSYQKWWTRTFAKTINMNEPYYVGSEGGFDTSDEINAFFICFCFCV